MRPDLDTRIVIASRITIVSFAVLFGVALIVFDGEPFVDQNGTTVFAHLFALLTLLAAVFLLTRQDTFVPWTSATQMPTAVIRDIPFVNTNGNNTWVTVRASMNAISSDANIIYWDSRGVSGVTQVNNRVAILDVSPGSDMVYYRTIRGCGGGLGPVKLLTIRAV